VCVTDNVGTHVYANVFIVGLFCCFGYVVVVVAIVVFTIMVIYVYGIVTTVSIYVVMVNIRIDVVFCW